MPVKKRKENLTKSPKLKKKRKCSFLNESIDKESSLISLHLNVCDVQDDGGYFLYNFLSVNRITRKVIFKRRMLKSIHWMLGSC